MSGDGGAAFPPAEIRDGEGNGILQAESGMSLRDYFAGQAMTGYLLGARSEGWALPNEHQANMLSANAYFVADAMLAERAKDSTP